MRYLAILLLTGCATTIPTDVTFTAVSVNWTEAADKDCRALGLKTPEQIAACATYGNPICQITAPKPRSFDDEQRLTWLGHEFLHCLGWSHGPRKGD